MYISTMHYIRKSLIFVKKRFHNKQKRITHNDGVWTEVEDHFRGESVAKDVRTN